MLLHDLPHVIVRIFHIHYSGAFPILPVQEIRTGQKQLFFLFKQLSVMITDNIVRSNFLHIAAYSIQMEEALIAFGIHWILLYRQQLLELLRDQNGIFHFAFGGTGMHTSAIYMKLCPGGIKILIFQFTQRTTVYGIRIICTKQFHIKMIRSGTDFLIRGETNADLAVLFLRMI